MTSFGVLDTGFSQKSLQDILDDIEARQEAAFGAQINTSGESVLGQQNAAFAQSIAEAWEVLGGVYRSFYPDSASGEALDNVAAITGSVRSAATRSTMTVTCTGTPGTVLLAGRVVSVQGTGDRFVSSADGIINIGGTVDIVFEAEEFGPIFAAAGTLDIETPVSGWAAAANALDTDTGQDLQADESFRATRETELRAQGASTVDTIRAKLLQIDNVVQAFAIDNPTDSVDSDSRPAHSVESIVEGGADADILQELFDTVCAGIQTYGHTGQKVSGIINDSQGFPHTVEFTRPDDVDIWFEVEVNVVAAEYPVDGDDQIKQALVDLGDALSIGEDVIYERFQAEVFSVLGVFDVPVFLMDTVFPPTGTANIPISIREVSAFDTTRITVTSTPV